MINIRLNKNGLMMAKPCEICQELLKYYNISSVIYSNKGDLWTYLQLMKK